MKRGRPNHYDLTATRGPMARRALEPPRDLRADEARLFRELVLSCSPDHFVETDKPLLVSFVQCTLLSRRAAADQAKDASALATWEKAVKLQATLATRLRLAPQSRIDAKTVGRRQAAHRPSAYDLMDDLDAQHGDSNGSN